MKKALGMSLILLWAGMSQAGWVDPGLSARLSTAGSEEELSVIVHLKAQADLTTFRPDQRPAMVAELHRVSETTQPALLSRYVNGIRDVGRFWIYNGFVCTARRDVIRDLAARPEVDFVCENARVHLADYEETPGIHRIEWNLRRVRADSVWRLRGYTGQGVVLGIIDTGVEVTHPVLQPHWRSQNGWYDGVAGSPTPNDSNGHGTFAMGIAVGAAPADSDTIGVAIGASFIAAKGISSGGSAQFVWLDSCFQWYARLCSLGTGPAAIINAWGGSRTETHFWQTCRNLQLLGVSNAFSVGGSGPGPGTVAAPGNYPCLFGLGATDNGDVVGSFSARGPAPTGYPWDSSASWLDPLWGTRNPTNHIKPDLVAPGVNIRSSYRGNTYVVMSGTSWGPPHVAGAIALMKQKNPSLTPAQQWQILTTTCDTFSWGNPYPNQNYGWGRLNCLRAIDATPSGVEEREVLMLKGERPRLAAWPNPMRAGCEIRWAGSPARPVQIGLYDVAGRRVRSLSGQGAVAWDGRGEDGKVLSGGVYFAVPERGEGTGVKIVVVR